MNLRKIGAMSLFVFGIICGMANFWLHKKPAMLPWYSLILWATSLLLLLIGSYNISTTVEKKPPVRFNVWYYRFAHQEVPSSQPFFSSIRWEVFFVLLITIIGFFLRQVSIGHIPHNLSGDEGEMGMAARLVLDGRVRDPFVTGWLSHPNLWFFLQALSLTLFGNHVAGLRTISSLIGTLTIPVFYLFVRPMYGKRVALTSIVLFAAYHFHIHYSRNALNNIVDPLMALLSFLAFLQGLRKPSLFFFTLTGVFLGVAQHFYMGTRVLPIVIVVVLLHQVIFNRAVVMRIRWYLLVMVLAFLLSLGPLGEFFIYHPDEFNARLKLVGIFSGWYQHQRDIGKSILEIFLEQAKGAFGAFTYVPDKSAQYDPGMPLLDSFSSIVFVFGIALLLTRWREKEAFLVLVWILCATIFGGLLLVNPPVSPRYVTTAPALCLVIALTIDQVRIILQRAIARSTAIFSAIHVAVVLALVLWNVHFYFYVYTPRNNFGWINVEVGTEVGKYLAQQTGKTFVYFFGPPRMYYGFGSIRFQAPDVPGVDMLEPMITPDELPPATQKGQRPIFIFLPEREGELDIVRQRYPEGNLYRFSRLNKHEILFISYDADIPEQITR